MPTTLREKVENEYHDLINTKDLYRKILDDTIGLPGKDEAQTKQVGDLAKKYDALVKKIADYDATIKPVAQANTSLLESIETKTQTLRATGPTAGG